MSVRIGFTDTFDPVPDFFMEMLDGLPVVRNDMNPQVLIFGDENFGSRNLDPKYDKCRKVFYTGENRRPWYYNCDSAITFDEIENFNGYRWIGNRRVEDVLGQPYPHFRLPLWILNIWHYGKLGLLIDGKLDYAGTWLPRDKFASFVVSNPNCTERNEFFHKLNTYQKVSSVGPLFNTTGFVLPRGETGVKDKIDFLSTCKYNICFENSSYPGYVSEKLIDAYLAGTIPIYWGSPTVSEDFNPKAFINVHDFASFDEVIEYIDALEKEPVNTRYFDMLVTDLLYDNDVVSNTKNRLQDWFEREVLWHIEGWKKS